MAILWSDPRVDYFSAARHHQTSLLLLRRLQLSDQKFSVFAPTTVFRGLIYAAIAFVAARIILGPPTGTGGWATSPYPMARVAALSGFLGHLVAMSPAFIPALRNRVFQGAARGLATVLFSHLLFGPFSYLDSLSAGIYGHVSFFSQFLNSLFFSLYSIVVVGYITFPLGALTGVVLEIVADQPLLALGAGDEDPTSL